METHIHWARTASSAVNWGLRQANCSRPGKTVGGFFFPGLVSTSSLKISIGLWICFLSLRYVVSHWRACCKGVFQKPLGWHILNTWGHSWGWQLQFSLFPSECCWCVGPDIWYPGSACSLLGSFDTDPCLSSIKQVGVSNVCSWRRVHGYWKLDWVILRPNERIWSGGLNPFRMPPNVSAAEVLKNADNSQKQDPYINSNFWSCR